MDWSEEVKKEEDECTAFAKSCIVIKTPPKTYSTSANVTMAPRKERSSTTNNNNEKQTLAPTPMEGIIYAAQEKTGSHKGTIPTPTPPPPPPPSSSEHSPQPNNKYNNNKNEAPPKENLNEIGIQAILTSLREARDTLKDQKTMGQPLATRNLVVSQLDSVIQQIMEFQTIDEGARSTNQKKRNQARDSESERIEKLENDMKEIKMQMKGNMEEMRELMLGTAKTYA
jgi:hypothetical protein